MTVLAHIGRAEKRLITAILPAGRGLPLIDRLKQEKGVLTAARHHARGVGGRRVKPGRMVFEEKDVIMVLVDADQAEAIFAFIYGEGGIGERHAGMMFEERILRGHPLMPFAEEAAGAG